MSVEPKKWGVIYNPKAGTRKVKKRWKEIKEYLNYMSIEITFKYSISPQVWCQPSLTTAMLKCHLLFLQC